MEVWDAYDQQRKLIAGLTLEREKFPYPEAWYHLAVNVWVQDEAGNWLFMRRAASKSNFPLVYEAGAGGSVLQGETAQDGALRELVEETGLQPLSIRHLFSFTEEEHLTHFDTFLVSVAGICPAVHYQPGETDDHKWVSKKELEAFFSQHTVFENQKQQLRSYQQTESE